MLRTSAPLIGALEGARKFEPRHNMIQYIAIVITFVAVLVGVRGGTWDDKRHRITKVGWATIALAAVTATGSMAGAYRDQKNLAWQESQREQVRRIAEYEIREAVQNIVHPFEILYENGTFGSTNLPYDGPDKYYCDAKYFQKAMSDQKFMGSWTSYKMTARPANPDVEIRWWEFFSRSALRGSERLDAIVQKYSMYLNPSTLVSIHSIQNDDFFRLRLLGLSDLNPANGGAEIIAQSFQDPVESDNIDLKHASYLNFVRKVSEIMSTTRTSAADAGWCARK